MAACAGTGDRRQLSSRGRGGNRRHCCALHVLYVSDDIREHLQQQLPELSQFLSQHYRPVLTDATEGVWWQRAAPLAVAGCGRDAGFTVP